MAVLAAAVVAAAEVVVGRRRCRRQLACGCPGNVGASRVVARAVDRTAEHDGNGHADGRSSLIELQALDHSTDRTDDELCLAVTIVPGDIHVIKDHVNPL
jgi:hypothetical protein